MVLVLGALAAAVIVVMNWPVSPPPAKPIDDIAQAAKPRFIDRGEIIEDTTTGLLWQKDGTASGKMNFQDAAKYGESLTLGGLSDWRVPTRAELKAIFPATDAPFINTKYNPNPYGKREPDPDAPREWHSYWTSDWAGPPEKDYAYIYQWYGKGGANNCYASRNRGLVRCVHDPKTQNRITN